MIMEANGLLDGCTKSAEESKEDGKFPHERCISDSELKTKGGGGGVGGGGVGWKGVLEDRWRSAA